MLAQFSFLWAIVLSLSLCSDVVVADSHGSQRRHHGANRLERDHSLSKRFDNARLSYYEAGQGACGAMNSDSDFIVALNAEQYAGGSHCFETITISYNGKTTQAQIADECPGCPYGGLDLTPGLFSFFASEDAGIIYGEWDFGSGASPTPKPTPTPTPTPTPIIVWTPTSTWSPPPPTTTKHSTSSPPPPSSSSSSPSSSSTPASSSASPTSSAPPSTSQPSTSSAAPTSSSVAPVPTPTGNLEGLQLAFVQLSALIVASEQTQ
ncbi:hypothetical protein PHLCEN_2v738 [Hermanssonia centrifuga]|uniref:Uncharacterized protein n=1 Tax=Hermanssonia centrifuga TaxID=98765 RepID=A0A2R6S573_9APHY|nr:hypothetical protein PHLCEN_2v738 [Hermanssonia centrifuga]